MMRTLLLSACLLPVMAGAGVSVDPVTEERTRTNVTLDDLIVMRSDDAFAEVRVADADIADVVVLTNRSFHVMGKTSGRTNVMLYDDQARLIDIIDVEVRHDLAGLDEALVQAFPLERIDTRRMAGGVYLSGDVSTTEIAERAYKIAQAFAPERVTNGLNVRDSHQVLLEVRFVEATRDVVRDLGLGLLAQDAGSFAVAAGSGALSSSAGLPALAGQVSQSLGGGVTLDARIEALEEEGVIRTLAEPNLVAMTGETASFLAGGEFPIPVPVDLGQVAIEYREFGVGLAFTPTVLDGGVINLKVAPEVSQIDTANSVRLQGVEVPGLRVRRANTTVELRNAQSFAIAGLLDNSSSNTKAQVPWLGDIPVLGALFRSTRYQASETELVIIVTPRLVQPVSDIRELRTPLDGDMRPSDSERFLMGNLEGRQRALLGKQGGR